MEKYLYQMKKEKDINEKEIFNYIVDLEGQTNVLNIETNFKGKARVIDFNIELEPNDKRYYINVLVEIKGKMYIDNEFYTGVSGKEWYYIGFNKDYTDIGEIDFCNLYRTNTQELLLDFSEDIMDLLDNVINNTTINDTQLLEISINKADLDRYNRLLALDLEENEPYYNREEMEELGAKKDDYIGILSKDLGKDYVLTIDLASGTSNYYDNIVIWKRFGNELVENQVLNCEFSLGEDFEIELENDKKYHIKWKVEE